MTWSYILLAAIVFALNEDIIFKFEFHSRQRDSSYLPISYLSYNVNEFQLLEVQSPGTSDNYQSFIEWDEQLA